MFIAALCDVTKRYGKQPPTLAADFLCNRSQTEDAVTTGVSEWKHD